MDKQIEDYLLWKSSYAPSASRSYRYPLLNIRKLKSLADVIEYKNRIEGKYSDSSVAYAMTVLRDFVKYLSAQKKSKIPFNLIRVPRFTPKRRTVSSREDVIKMLNTFDDTKFTELRNRVMIRMMADTGMRVSELVDLNISDIQDNHAIIRTKKANKERVVMWSRQTQQELNKYLGVRICVSSTSPVFISLYPKNPRITSRQIERIIRKACYSAGIKKAITPHSLRHGKAHEMLDRGANVKEIAQVLGHSELNPRAAFQYIQLDSREQFKILKKYI